MKTERKSALIAGIALIIMAVVAGFIYGYIHHTLIVEGDSENTFRSIKSDALLFQTEIFGWFLILILDVIVAWALYVFFRNENKKLSLLTAALRIVFVFIFGAAIYSLIDILKIIGESVDEIQMAGEQIMKSVESFETIWSFALIIFGFHLLLMGILVLQSKNIHIVWGLLLVFAAISYIVIHSAKFLLPDYQSQIATAEMILSLPMAFGEVGFAFWLIVRGGKQRIVYRQTKAVAKG